MISRHLLSVLYYGVSYMNQINSLIAQLARWKKKKKKQESNSHLTNISIKCIDIT